MASLALSEVGRALDGALALSIGRPVPPGAFDVSLGGLWRSFAALILTVPSAIVQLAALGLLFSGEDGQPVTVALSGTDLLEQIVTVAGQSIALPLALLLLVRPLGIASGYVAFVVVRNWCGVVWAALCALPALLFNVGILGRTDFVFLTLAATGLVLWFEYRIARLVLGADRPVAILVLLLDMVLGTLVILAVGGAFGG